ncbi:MAG TPA: hypothetical protein VGO57_09595 [Verrucomicrobiae bacterium]|jgi:hypothetical protein
MAANKINKIHLRKKMADKEIFTFADLARKAHCSETAIHLAMERPSRFSKVVASIVKILDLKDISEVTKVENQAIRSSVTV